VTILQKNLFFWFIIVYCFFTVGSVKLLQLSYVIFFGEELTQFGFVREECEKNFENHCSKTLRCFQLLLVLMILLIKKWGIVSKNVYE